MLQILYPAVAVVVALVPAALAFWWGRGVARLADDPVLPERLMANRSRNGFVTALALALLITTAPQHLAWALPLLALTRMAAAYPLRIALHRETWSLFAYLSFFVRLALAALGFWILLAILPVVAVLAGPRDWIVAAMLAAIALAWSAAYSTVFRVLLHAKALDDPVLLSRFSRMREECGLPLVRLDQIDLHGGVFANAVALPSIRQPAVAITETLVARLDPDETMGILAHELAHLEYYNPRRLRWNSLVTYSLVAVGALAAPITRLVVPQALTVLPFVWPIVMVFAVLLRARHRQKHETSSDLRAVALTGDPEALVRALSKTNAFARLPRRWDTEFERNATHPSLARRVQAIRAAAGGPAASIGDASTFAAADQVSSVTFHQDRLFWQENASTSHTMDYGRLSELRINARASGAARLVAVDAAHRRWELALQATDVARLQAVLDIVDTRLGHAATPPPVSLGFVRIVAVLMMLAVLVAGQYSALLPGWFALVVAASPLAAAAGVAAVGAAGLTWRDRALRNDDQLTWLAVGLLVCGVALVAMAIANRRDKQPRAALQLTGALAIFAALSFGVIALGGFDAIDLHHGARQWPAAPVFGLALAGALAFGRSRAMRYASAVMALAGCVAAFLGSTAFLDRFVHDPLLAPAGSLLVKTLSAPALTEFPVPFGITHFWLSPTGRYVALGSEDEQERMTIHAGRAGGTLTGYQADEAAFIGEHRVLLLDRQRSTSVIRAIDLDEGPRELWSRRVELSAARLSLDSVSEKWRLLGWNEDGDIVSVTGETGGTAVREERWKSPADIDVVDAIAVWRENVLALETRYRPWFFDSGPLWRMASVFRPGSRSESRFWTLSAGQRSLIASSRLDITCRSSSFDDQLTTCAAFDGTRTRLFTVDPAERRMTPLVSMRGRLYVRGDSGRGWLTGWWNRTAVVVRTATGEAISVADRDGQRAYQLATSEQVLGAVSSTPGGSTIRVYALDGRISPRPLN